MAIKRQHYVPQTYLKNWETKVSSKSEPSRYFDGINYFEKNDLSIGDERNIDSILWQPHIHTVDYKSSFMLRFLPQVEKDYIGQVVKN
ncbi:DUF4238 domain-containing protein [Clostridium arbusti]|uniref:DUF4238 domain-containing protein n=1 Tax=Clostridium arbusti TaxID=1137848 RepID=UPI000289070E|nr:DUF4238 domain-containing protein [Clostridium arbusti]